MRVPEVGIPVHFVPLKTTVQPMLET